MMKNTRRTATGLLATAAFALTLLANGGAADAKTRGAGGHSYHYVPSVPTVPTTVDTTTAPADQLVIDLGITWE